MKLKFNIGYPTVVIIPLLFVFSLLVLFAAFLHPEAAGAGGQPVATHHENQPVAPTTSPSQSATEAKGTIYLTFDDGPDRYTDDLLKVLAENHVKATFFVTNCHPEYQNCIAKEYAAGHAVGVHSYSHNYAKIYSSEHAFWEDFDAMDKIIVHQTGHPARLLRFPGGSNNLVSKKHSRGLMRKLTREADERGLTYVDWNAQCGDSDGLKTSYGVYRRMICQVANSKEKNHIMLCHDIKPYTVKAVGQFIQWAKANGYAFAVVTPDGFNVHLQPNN